MSLKQIFFFIILGSASLVSVKALNMIFYTSASWFLVAQILFGPLAAIILLSKKYKKYRVRMIVGIITFTGIFGLVKVGSDLLREYLYEDVAVFSHVIYFYHGLLSIVCIVVFFVWYFFEKKQR